MKMEFVKRMCKMRAQNTGMSMGKYNIPDTISWNPEDGWQAGFQGNRKYNSSNRDGKRSMPMKRRGL